MEENFNIATLRKLFRKNAGPLFGLIALTACSVGETPSAPTPSEPPAQGGAPTAAQRATLVFHGGPIYTANDATPTVDAVAVRGDRIIATGPTAEILARTDETTTIIDLKGAALFPGFVDAHAHLIGIGERELTLNLENVRSIAELVSIVKTEVADARPDAVIVGRGWIETGWPEDRFPSKNDIDPISPDHAVILTRADGHALLANSVAMETAKIARDTADPDGGRIERDENGDATGIFIDNAMNLIRTQLSAPDITRKREAYRAADRVYRTYGWTGLHNMSVSPENVSLMETMSDENTLSLRVYNSINSNGLSDLAATGERRSTNERVTTRAVKLYVDGALGSRGAALSAPYADAPETDGLLLLSQADAAPMFDVALRAGIQINTHAIGDRGNRLVLQWYADAFAATPTDERAVAAPRWRIEHAQIIHPEDAKRFSSLGVIPSMQPSHAIGDLYFAPDRLGPDRLDGAYAWRLLIDEGSIIAGGSDAPVERGDPLIEFYAAVARRGLDGFSNDDWRPAQAVTRDEALKMFTLWPAIASFQEKDLGSIETGKKADFTVFSTDIMTAPAADILTADAMMTVIDGEIVHRSGL